MEWVIWKFSNNYHQRLIAAYNYSYTHLLITWNKQQRLHLKLEEDSYRRALQTEVSKHYLKHLVEQLLEYGIHTFSPLPMVQLQKLFGRRYTCTRKIVHQNLTRKRMEATKEWFLREYRIKSVFLKSVCARVIGKFLVTLWRRWFKHSWRNKPPFQLFTYHLSEVIHMLKGPWVLNKYISNLIHIFLESEKIWDGLNSNFAIPPPQSLSPSFRLTNSQNFK